MGDSKPIILEGRHVRLKPISQDHRSDLAKVALDPELWRFTPTQIHTDKDLHAYIETALSSNRDGTARVFATINRSTGAAIGSTRFGNIDSENRRAEIGWSWLGRDFQRKAYNTEAKLLMLAHAFESMGCIRVEFRADVLNTKSRNAIVRLGAKEEGILRHHMILPNGRTIDWVYYSILRDEWSSVRKGLEQKLASHNHD